MSHPPYITVVVPVHNKRPHLKRCVDSVLAQTFSDYELLLIDDASTDGSLDEIYAYEDARIKVLKRSVPGPGGYAARNHGLAEATADWIAFLDADDEWMPQHLLLMTQLISKNPDYGIFGAGWESCNGNLVKQQDYYTRFLNKGVHDVSLRSYLESALRKERYCNSSVVVVNKSKMINAGGFPAGSARKGGDLCTWIKMLANYQGLWSPHIGARVYRDAVNMVTKSEVFSPDLFHSLIHEIEGNLDDYENRLLRDYVNHLLLKGYLQSCVQHGVPQYLLRQHVLHGSLSRTLAIKVISLLPPRVIYHLGVWRRSLKS